MRASAGGDPVITATKLAVVTLGRRVVALDAEAKLLDARLGDFSRADRS
jgi:hypothetical protein